MKNQLFPGLALILTFFFVFQTTELLGRTIHVSPSGNDNAMGDLQAPYRSVNKAASVAVAGDVVAIHAGVYRERVIPKNSGAAGKPITYRAAGDGEVIIKGSEPYNNFIKVKKNIWKTSLDSSKFYKGWNPYAVKLNDKKNETCGAVYKNGIMLNEAKNKAEFLKTKNTWKVNKKGTKLFVNLGYENPNDQTMEIAMRAQIFAPEMTNYNKIHYITISNITFNHTGSQFHGSDKKGGHDPILGAVNLMAGHHWIIENCRFVDVKTSGIGTGWVSRGSYLSRNTLNRKAVYANLKAGHNIFRGNLFKNCGSNGIMAAWDCFSKALQNRFINCNNQHFPYNIKTAGIKLMWGFNWLIQDNYFKDNKVNSLWIDWTNTGCRVTGNVFNGDRFWYEASHGPVLVDNNVFLDAKFLISDATGIRAVHNLFYNTEVSLKEWKNRKNGFFFANTALNEYRKAKFCDIANNLFFNNMWINSKAGIKKKKTAKYFYDNRAANNIYMQNSTMSLEDNNSLSSSVNTAFNYTATEEEVDISFELDGAPWRVATFLINADSTGSTPKQKQSINVTIDQDYFGNKRNPQRPLPGSFATIKKGANSMRIWPKGLLAISGE